MPALRDATAIEAALTDVPGWGGRRRRPRVHRRAAGLSRRDRGVARVDEIAEGHHHPDMDIRWRSVTLRCSTHCEGGITRLDLDLAKAIST